MSVRTFLWLADKGMKELTICYRCRPAYLSEEAHKTLSQPGAFDGLRVHTDEFVEVLARIKPETVTVAVVRPVLHFPCIIRVS